MRILHENFEGEEYIDILVSEDELEELKSYCLFSHEIDVDGKKFNLGLKIDKEKYEMLW